MDHFGYTPLEHLGSRHEEGPGPMIAYIDQKWVTIWTPFDPFLDPKMGPFEDPKRGQFSPWGS